VTDSAIEALPPSIQPLATVAAELGDCRESAIFIGGAIAPLLQTAAPFPKVRPTRDVDAISAAGSSTAQAHFEDALGKRGFRHDLAYRGHANRWISPSGIAFDLVPAGGFLGASGNQWDQMAVVAAERSVLGTGVAIKHASAPFFLILKWSAYRDRGKGNALGSTDIEDLLALLASRPTLVDEIERLPTTARDYLRGAAQALLGDPDFGDLLEAHLNNAVPRGSIVEGVRRALETIAQ
jgi:predicted nucleotidyltransferase